ncbi:ABC transporter ATP-binding protein [Bacillus safensis]|uniref:ABC transporter ATP-binding protein n=1 Tax=Bacillus safensis TaxID=561879 RepID=UPI00273E5A61|nr:ABC transporter ATP-binding protein [Bacillus safensis]MEE3679549.1 ABC transporter ATP-binding protein [Bacillus safensis]
MSNTILKLKDIEKTFILKNQHLSILKKVNIEVKEGDFSVIMGPSGSGKSTLLNLMGLLDSPSEGSICLNQLFTTELNERSRAKLRSEFIGFIYQEFNLLPNLDVLNNVTLPLLIHKNISKKEREERAKELLNLVGLSHRITHFPRSLSGGEKQRVAIARSLINNPKLILADEPTGNVDEANEIKIIELFKKLSSSGVGIVIVTHNPIFTKYSDHFYTMRSGILQEDTV